MSVGMNGRDGPCRQVVDSRLPPAVFVLPVDIPGKRLLLRVTERDLEGDNLLEVRTVE